MNSISILKNENAYPVDVEIPQNSISILPTELKVEILSYLSPRDATALFLTGNDFYQLKDVYWITAAKLCNKDVSIAKIFYKKIYTDDNKSDSLSSVFKSYEMNLQKKFQEKILQNINEFFLGDPTENTFEDAVNKFNNYLEEKNGEYSEHEFFIKGLLEINSSVNYLIKQSTGLRNFFEFFHFLFSGNSLFHLAVTENFPEILKFLIEKFPDYLKTGYGSMTLFAAVDANKIEAAKILIEGGVNLDATNSEGNTAQMMAAEYGQTEIFNLILEKRQKTGIFNILLSLSFKF